MEVTINLLIFVHLRHRKMNKIYFVPVGGLANRFRAVASAAVIAEESGSQLNIFWFQDWALNAPFRDFFEPLSIDGCKLHEASFIHHLLYDRPRSRNLYLPRIYQKIRFEHCIYEEQIETLRKKAGYFSQLAKEGDVYIASFNPMVVYPSSLLRSIFRPLPFIVAQVEERCQRMSDYCIGVHVRRTDHVTSIANSPDELFFEALDKEIELHRDVTIYLATDSEEVKQSFKERYGNRLFYSSAVSDRNSSKGIGEAIVEMFTLSKMRKIYGSFGSSFSELAAQFGDIPLTILKK